MILTLFYLFFLIGEDVVAIIDKFPIYERLAFVKSKPTETFKICLFYPADSEGNIPKEWEDKVIRVAKENHGVVYETEAGFSGWKARQINVGFGFKTSMFIKTRYLL